MLVSVEAVAVQGSVRVQHGRRRSLRCLVSGSAPGKVPAPSPRRGWVHRRMKYPILYHPHLKMRSGWYRRGYLRGL